MKISEEQIGLKWKSPKAATKLGQSFLEGGFPKTVYCDVNAVRHSIR